MLRGVVAGAVVAAAAVVGPLGASSVSAAPSSFVVDDGTDAVDAGLDGVCATAAGTCTLRAAIQEANHLSGTTEIRFAPSADTLGLNLGGDGGADVGDLDLGPGVTVHLIGNQLSESETTTVKLGSLGDRAFHVTAGARLELDLVHLAGGSTTDDGGAILNEGQVLITNRAESTGTYLAVSSSSASGMGGAIANLDGASLEIRNVSTSAGTSRVDLFGNTAGTTGGAIANRSGTVLLEGNTSGGAHDVYVDASSATGDGGSIHNSTGSVTLGCRAFARFSSAARGGGVFNAAGSLTFAGGGVDGGNAGGDGGGVYNDTTATLTVASGSCGALGQISRSAATGDGGALFNLGTVNIPVDTTLSVSGSGSGRDASSGGGVAQAGGSIDVAGDVALQSVAAERDGGAVAISGGTVATSGDGSISVEKGSAGGAGGGLAVIGGSLDASAVVQSSWASDGGGVAVTDSGSATLRSSAVLDSTATRGGGIAVTDGGALAVRNTTIGRSSGPGGGIEVDGASLSLQYVTLADNWPFGIRSNVGVSLSSSLVARNNGTNCIGVSSGGDHNVVDDWTCSPTGDDLTDGAEFDAVSNGIESDPSGGQPYSYELEPGSPALDVVDGKGCGDPAVDQQGSPRPLDGDGDGIASCDAGAIEAPATDLVVRHRISGTVYDEATLRPIERACIYMVNVDGGDGDGELVRTDDAGAYAGAVTDGRYLLAFFVPDLGDDSGDAKRDCGEAGIDRAYQPEWYRNVPVEFEDETGAAADDPGDGSGDDGGSGGDDDQVVMPDLSEVTLVTVDGADVTSIDACLGAGPGAGLDVPCGDAAGGLGTPATPAATPTPASAAGAGESASTPASLAFTGANALPMLLSVALLLGGTALLLARRRREDGRSR